MNNSSIGSNVPFDEALGAFKAPEGEANLYFGRIRSGKTYGATADIFEEVERGRIVYATWPIKLEEKDQRNSFLFLLRGIFLPWYKRYYRIPCPENLHYINAETGEVDGVWTFDARNPKSYIDYLNTLNHCSLYIDEAWRVLAHQVMGKESTLPSFNLILVTGHKYRTVNLIAQRTMAVIPMVRANIGRFYEFSRMLKLGPIVLFMRKEYQDMVGEDVDMTAEPVSRKIYFGRRKIFKAYNSWYYGDLDPLHALKYEAFDLTYPERVYALLRRFVPSSVVRVLNPFFGRIFLALGRNPKAVSAASTDKKLPAVGSPSAGSLAVSWSQRPAIHHIPILRE